MRSRAGSGGGGGIERRRHGATQGIRLGAGRHGRNSVLRLGGPVPRWRAMKPRLCLGIALSLLALSLLQAAELKFTTLFNGKDLTGWTGKESAKFWRVEQ